MTGCSCPASVTMNGIGAGAYTGNAVCGGVTIPMTLGCQFIGSPAVRKWTFAMTTVGGFTGGSCLLAEIGDCGTLSCSLNVTCGGSPSIITVVVSDPIFCTYAPC